MRRAVAASLVCVTFGALAVPGATAGSPVVTPRTATLANGTRFHEAGHSAEYISWFGASLPLSSSDAQAYSAEGNKTVTTVAVGYVSAHPASAFPAHRAIRIVGSQLSYVDDGQEILPLAPADKTSCLANLGQHAIAVVPNRWASRLTLGPDTVCAKPGPEGAFSFVQTYVPREDKFDQRGFQGDFNGDGKQDELLFGEGCDPDELWYGTNNGFRLGPIAPVNGFYDPVAGDFNGDGKDDVLWVAIDAPEGKCGSAHSTTNLWLGSSGNTAFTHGAAVPKPPGGDGPIGKTSCGNDFVTYANYRPIIGDYNGDGKDDIYWYLHDTTETSIPPNVIWYGAASGVTIGSKSMAPYPAFREDYGYECSVLDYVFPAAPLVGDYDGDHRADFLWYFERFSRLWRGTNGAFVNVPIPSVYFAYIPIIGDFDGDGRSDVLWYALPKGADSLWRGTTSGFAPGPHVNIDGRYDPYVGDFNGDGRTDIYWRQFRPGADHTWFGTLAGFTNGPDSMQPAPLQHLFGPRVLSAGDYNGDGHDDIVWRYATYSNREVDNFVDLWRAH